MTTLPLKLYFLYFRNLAGDDGLLRRNIMIGVCRLYSRKRNIFVFFVVSFATFLFGMMRTTNEFHLYNQQLIQRSMEFNSLQNMFQIKRQNDSKTTKYNVREIRNIIPQMKPRVVLAPENRLFRRTTDDLITSIMKSDWKDWKDQFCDGNLYNFKGSIILMKNVIIDPSKKNSVAKGGESIESVIGHTEKDEVVNVQHGFFNVPCDELPRINFARRSHFQNWYEGISKREFQLKVYQNVSSFTVLIQRGDYANLYWTLIELYNTYLTIRLLGENPKATEVILMDAHPIGKLDYLWTVLFGKVYRIGEINSFSFHEKIAWVNKDGPMPQYVQSIPFIEEFKFALYEGTNSSTSPNPRHNCLDTQNVTLILRKDYVAHPRNPGGRIKRKLSNEKEIIEYLKVKISNANINAVQIDLLSIEEQIKLIYESSVLIGVHGAGLGHTLLLRSGSTLIELFPSSYKRSPNPHFQQFAFWADVHYDRWYSSSPPVKKDEWVYVDPDIPYKLITHALERNCKDSNNR